VGPLVRSEELRTVGIEQGETCGVIARLVLLKDDRIGCPHGDRNLFDEYTVSACDMKQFIAHVALVVRDYDEAIAFYTKKLGFTLVEDTYQPAQDKRWVVVAPPGSTGASLLLARASQPAQEPFIGNQTGGRVFLFLATDDFQGEYQRMVANGVTFIRAPKVESYGTVAVFSDLYGNLWDLIEFSREDTTARSSIFAS
jgi:catechol 2,3-dioxygenase-like lactoylglutathione lyase family enzyme